MSDKTNSFLKKAQQERKRGQFARAVKHLEQGIAAHPDEIDLYLEAIDVSIEGGELVQATNFLKTVQERFKRESDHVLQFVQEKLKTVHDPALARCVVEHSVKRRDFESASSLLESVPDHTIRELIKRAGAKAQSLKSAAHGGHALQGEQVTNELTNAVLAIRLGNLKDGIAIFVRVVHEKPAESKGLEPFLAGLSSRNSKSGIVRYARACVTMAGGNEVDAIHHFIDAARLDHACADDCIEQLRAMLTNPRHPDKIRRALAETLLIKGDLDAAAKSLAEYLADNPANTREVIMLLRPFIDPAHGLNACTWFAIEQALTIEQSSVALEILRSLQRPHGAELLQWLEERSTHGFLPADIMIFHGTVAIEQKKFERAAEILAAVCSNAPNDAPAVLSVISSHRAAHPSLEALFVKYAPEEAPPSEGESTSENDSGDFEMFEASEFRLEKSRNTAPTSSTRPANDKPKVKFSSSPFASSREDEEDKPREKATPKPFVDARELSLDEDSTDSGGESAVEGESAMESQIEITEAHAENVGQKLYLAGAAAFFHIDDDGSKEPPPAPAEPRMQMSNAQAPVAPAPVAPAPVAPAPVAPAPVAPVAAEPAPPKAPPAPKEAPKPDEPFETRFARFGQGELSNTEILVLLEESVEGGHADELHELLYFEPETSTEHFARYYYQAEYHILRNRPLQALEILARLDTPDLDNEQKRRVWYKIAVSQRLTQNYSGAATTLERLVELFPDREELVRLKRRNQEQCLSEQSLEATTLEKTSSLD